MTRTLNLLVVEDSEADYLLAVRILRQGGLTLEAQRLDRVEDLRRLLAEFRWDAVISDYSVPGMDLRQTLAIIQAHSKDLPVVMFSGSVGEEEAVALLKEGIHDFVVKDRPNRLPSALMNAVADSRSRTYQRQALAALAASEARFQATFEQAAVGIAQVALDGQILSANQRLCQILGYPRQELLGLTSQQLSHPDPAKTTWAMIRRMCAGEFSTFTEEKINLRKDGSPVWVSLSVSLVRDLKGEPDYIVSVVEDIQGRKDAEAEAQKWIGAFMACAHGIALQEVGSGAFSACNPAFAQMLDRSQAEVLTLDLPQIVAAANRDLLPPLLAETDQLGRTQFETELLRKDGSSFAAQVDLVRQNHASGGPRHRVATIQDITARRDAELARRAMERELDHMQRLESVGRLAGGVSHDMNNVLGAIMAMASVLEARDAQHPGVRSSAQAILNAAIRGRDLVKGLTDFARKDAPEAKPLDINALIRREADLLERTTFKKMDIRLALQEPLPEVLGESSALANVLMNLCVNACDAMPAGGTLTLSSRLLDHGRIELAVTDTGEGMAPEVQARAQEAFFTTKPAGKGTGLGLAIVAATIKLHGGSMALDSSPGQGTRVRLTLPALLEPLPEPVPVPVAVLTGTTRLRVFLVDDEELIRACVPLLLEHLGHQTEVAAGGEAALKMLEQGLETDLVILDINMPGMDGLEVLSRLRVLRPELPVLLATGFVDERIPEILQRFPRVRVLKKPYLIPDLQAGLLSWQ